MKFFMIILIVPVFIGFLAVTSAHAQFFPNKQKIDKTEKDTELAEKK